MSSKQNPFDSLTTAAVEETTTKTPPSRTSYFTKRLMKPNLLLAKNERKTSAATMATANNMTEFPPAKKARLSSGNLCTQNVIDHHVPINLIKDKPIKKPVVDWDGEDKDNFYINLGEGFSSAELPKIIKAILDNPIFGRLRNIKQTGVAHFVFPDTSHNRFTHSMGTAAIAYLVVKKLQKQKINGKPPMTGSEILCVVIAALCHDLGHGPYSHLCEELFIQQDGSHFTHEQMSTILFDKMLQDYPAIKEALDPYFTDYHYSLIKDLINPPSDFPETSNKKWNLQVGPEKAFLYAIVNNPISGLDVDKMEYLFRDSKRSGISGFTWDNIERFIKKIRICATPNGKFNWLAFPDGDQDNVRSIFDGRKKLHSTVYSHKNVLAINEMFVQAFKLAGPHLKFLSDDDEPVTLKQCFSKDYLDLYINLTDDYLVGLIKASRSKHPDMIKAREIIKDVECRKFSKSIFSFENLNQHYPCLEATAIKNALQNCQLSFSLDDLSIVRRDFHGGKGIHVNPMDNVLFYSRYDATEANYFECAPSAVESIVHIFAPNACQESDVNEIFKALKEYLFKHANELRPPRRKFRNNQKENAIPYF